MDRDSDAHMMPPLLHLYLQWNALLGAAAVAFLLGERFLKRASSRDRLRLAQILVAMALIAPLAPLALPKHPVSIPLAVQAPLAEMGNVWSRATQPSRKKKRSTPPSQPRAAEATARIPIRHAAVALLWAVFLALAARLVFARRKLRNVLEDAALFKQIGRTRIVVSAVVAIPFSAYFRGQAWIVLPEAMLGTWKDFKLATQHELQHHRQRDTQWAIAVEVLRVLFFANPAIHFWKRKIQEFQELSCDESLIGRKVSAYEYGSCLVRVAGAALGNRGRLIGTVSMAADSRNPNYCKSFLRRRVEMLTEVRKGTGRKVLTLWGTTVAMSLVTLAYGAQQLGKVSEGTVAAGVVTTEPQIQHIADRALKAALTRHKASLGFVVVSDPSTGRVLAVANEDRVEPLGSRSPHWALSLRIGPASIAKAIVAAAAVQNGTTKFGDPQNCENGHYTLAGVDYQDWKPFDKLTTADTLVHSSNICGIKVGETLGAYRVEQAFKDFGFGPGGTAEKFPESRSGEMVTPNGKDDLKYVATVSTGYGGIYATPLEIVQAFGAIANGGELLKPKNSATNAVKAEVIRRVLSEGTAAETREVLAEVMVHGTGQGSASKLYKLAGKTATGYSRTHVGHDTLGGDSNMAAFVGFAPADKPRVVILAVVENPTDMKGVHGASHAAPLFKEVAEKTLSYLKVPTN